MGKIVQKNKDIPESVNSIDAGAIFPPRSGHDLSRNVFVVSIYAFQKNSYAGIGSGMSTEIVHEL